MGKKTNSFDYKTLASYLLPKDILKFFDVTGVEEVHTGNVDLTGTEIDFSNPNGGCAAGSEPRWGAQPYRGRAPHQLLQGVCWCLKKIYGHLPYNSVFLSKVL